MAGSIGAGNSPIQKREAPKQPSRPDPVNTRNHQGETSPCLPKGASPTSAKDPVKDALREAVQGIKKEPLTT